MRSFSAAVFAFAVVMLGTTLPTPLYSTYAATLHFDVLTTTIIFAVYAAGVIVALICFGRWSDQLGRRPLLAAGALLSFASAIVFITAGPVWQLMIGRVLSGLSAGIYAGAATAAVIELAPPSWRHRAPAVATAANIGGLGLGPLIAGLLAQYAPQPLHLPFAVHMVLLVAVMIGIWFMAEPVQPKAHPSLRAQRLSVPTDMRGIFVRAAIAAFAGFAVMGTFTGVAPSFISKVIGIDNHAVAGIVVSTLFLASAAAQIAGRPMQTDHALIAGSAILVVGVGVVTAALIAQSVGLLFAGALIAGAGQGLAFSKGLASVVAAAPPDRRAEVTSTYFVVAYVAISIPIVGEGFAAAHWGLQRAGEVFNVAVGVLALVALVLTVVAVRRADAPTPVETTV